MAILCHLQPVVSHGVRPHCPTSCWEGDFCDYTVFSIPLEPSHDLSSQTAFDAAGSGALCFPCSQIEAVCLLRGGGGKSSLNSQGLSAYSEATNKHDLGLTLRLDFALCLCFSWVCSVEYLVLLCPTPSIFLGCADVYHRNVSVTV